MHVYTTTNKVSQFANGTAVSMFCYLEDARSRLLGYVATLNDAAECCEREDLYIDFSLPWEPYTVCRHEYGKCSLTSNESFLNNSSMALNSLYLKHARPESSFPWTQSLLICSMADSNFQETLVLVGCATVRDAKITTQQILSRRAIFGRHCLSRRRLICSVLRCDLAESLFAIVTAINHGADFIPRC